MASTDDQKVIKRYICVGKEQKGLAANVRKMMNETGLRCFGEFHRSGGGDGDLAEEIAELDSFRINDGQACANLYTVIDASTNGYAECVSVIISGESQNVKVILTCLDQLGFVNRHEPLRERPVGFKSFGDYLDDLYTPSRNKPFDRNAHNF